MAVLCQQLVNGEALDPEWVVEPTTPGTDADLLQAKAASAADKGWDIEWLDAGSFVARLVRWDPPALCERVFRIG